MLYGLSRAGIENIPESCQQFTTSYIETSLSGNGLFKPCWNKNGNKFEWFVAVEDRTEEASESGSECKWVKSAKEKSLKVGKYFWKSWVGHLPAGKTGISKTSKRCFSVWQCAPRPWMLSIWHTCGQLHLWCIWLFNFIFVDMLCLPWVAKTASKLLCGRLLEAWTYDIIEEPLCGLSEYVMYMCHCATFSDIWQFLFYPWQAADKAFVDYSLAWAALATTLLKIKAARNMEPNKIAHEKFNENMVCQLKQGYNKFPPPLCCLAQTLFPMGGAETSSWHQHSFWTLLQDSCQGWPSPSPADTSAS